MSYLTPPWLRAPHFHTWASDRTYYQEDLAEWVKLFDYKFNVKTPGKHRKSLTVYEVISNDVRRMTLKDWEEFPLHEFFENLTYRNKVFTEHYM